LRIKTTHRNSEFRIIGLSEKTCYEEKWDIIELAIWVAMAYFLVPLSIQS
jgi:hypothetical protein